MALLIGLWVNKGVTPAYQRVYSDFANYYVSAQLIVSRESIEMIYDNEWFQNKIKEYSIDTPGKFAPFPPVTAFVLIPLTPFNPLMAQRIFIVVNLSFGLLGAWMIRKITNWPWSTCALLLLSSGLSLINNFAFGQLYLIMTVMVLVAIFLSDRGWAWPAAGLLAGVTAVKYFAIVTIGGYLLLGLLDWKIKPFRKNHNLKIGLLSMFLLTLIEVLQYLYFGPHITKQFVQSAFIPHMGGSLSGQNPFAFQFQSWESLLRNIFVTDVNNNPDPFLNSPSTKSILALMIVFLVVLTATICLYRARNSANRNVVFLSVPILALMTILPASATYHFIILIVPVCLLTSSTLLTKQERVGVIVLFVLVGFIPYQFFFNLSRTSVLFAFPRLALVTLLFVFVTWRILTRLKIEANLIST